MPRPVACSSCRQDKLRCDAYDLAPNPCTRCRDRDLTCSIDKSFRRIPTRRRLQHLAQEVQDLKQSLSRTANSAASASPQGGQFEARALLEPVNTGQGFLRGKLTDVESSDGQVLSRLGDVILVQSEVNDLFREYFQRYHPLFPILDPTITPSALQRSCPTLFWTVLATASRSIQPEIFPKLCDLVSNLISPRFLHQSYSVQPCQTLLILCMFPAPIMRVRQDVRWIYSGMAMQMATRGGLHKIGLDHEYQKAGAVSAAEKDRRELTRTWYCCCYVNATLSAEFGLPSSIPQDALTMEEVNRAGLPVDFAFAVRLTLESMKISRLVDLKTSAGLPNHENATHFGLLGMLETNLNALADSMRTKDATLGSITEYSLLMAKLNLCSFGLNQATKLRTPEATQLLLSAFDCTTRLIQLLVTTPLISAQVDGTLATPSLPMQAYYPRAYWRGLGYACLALLKLSLTKSLPELHISQSENAIQQAVDLFRACSAEEGDEFDNAARLIHLLGQEAVQEILKPRHEVRSRMGASLMYEMILSAVAWKRQRNEDSISSVEENASRTDAGLSMPGMSPRATDERIASSDYLLDGMGGPMGLDTNFWDTSAFDQLFAIDAAVDEHSALRNPAPCHHSEGAYQARSA